MAAAAITLPGGFWRDGVHHREAELRPLTGEDEAFLLDLGASSPPARRTTLLLARCLARLGPWTEAVPAEAVRELTVGDREALLLQLRSLSLGDRMQCVLRCPDPACGEQMDLDVDVRDLLDPPYPHAAPWYEESFEESGTTWKVRFRLPTGADQEETAGLARTDVAAAARLILRNCVESPEEDLPPAVAERLGARMAELDPQAELALQLTCPACGRDFSSQLDAASYFFQELTGAAVGLWREVHRLALAYHWSEPEILRLTGRKRRLYLGLLAEGGEGGR
jgi:hypothetical protein